MPERLTAEGLTQLLERLSVARGGTLTPAQAADDQVEALCARITLLTEALRDVEPGEAARLASRLLLTDLAQVTALFRARANGIGASLDAAVEQMRSPLNGDRFSPDPSA